MLSLMFHRSLGTIFLSAAIRLGAQGIEVPRTWDEAALKDWATPIAGLGVPRAANRRATGHVFRTRNQCL